MHIEAGSGCGQRAFVDKAVEAAGFEFLSPGWVLIWLRNHCKLRAARKTERVIKMKDKKTGAVKMYTQKAIVISSGSLT